MHSSFGVPADGNSFSSGCIKQHRAARHSLVRVETAEGRKRNARKVRSLGAVLKSRLESPPGLPLPCVALVLDNSSPEVDRRFLPGQYRSSAQSEGTYPASSLETGCNVVSVSLFQAS